MTSTDTFSSRSDTIFTSTTIFSPSLSSPISNKMQSMLSPTAVPKDAAATQSYTQKVNDSLLFDAVTETLHSSTSGGGDTIFSRLSGSLSPSYSSVFDLTPDLFNSSKEVNETAGLVQLPGDVSGQGKVISASMFVDSVSVPTTISPTPLSSVMLSESLMPSTVWNKSTDGSDEGVPLSDTLIIVIPVGLAILLFLIIVIVLCIVCCCRRQKKKKEVVKAGQGDLWVDPDSQQAPLVPITLLSISDSEPSASATTPGTASVAAAENSSAVPVPPETRQFYTAIYEFPGQLDSQLTLTPGDVIEVLERADNGWLRGVIKGDNRSGWFPSSFVAPVNMVEDDEQPASPSAAASSPTAAVVSDQPAQSGRPRISSFLIRKKPTKRPPQLDNVLGLAHLHSQNSLNKKVRPVIAVAPISPVKVVITSPLSAEDFSTSVRDKFFKAMFQYKAAYKGELSLREGEIIVGKERDRNGWMLGKRLQSAEEGWFPAVYVDQVTGDFTTATKATGEDENNRMTSLHLNPQVYSVLEANRNKSPDQSWVAIEHRVVHEFLAEGEAQMSLKVGDVVAVVQAPDNGWWLGCQGDRLGWFPADRVELMEERSEGKLDSFRLLPLCHDPQDHQRAHHHNHAVSSSTLDCHDQQEKLSSHNVSQESILSEGAKPRPARRAPMPPLQASKQLQGSLGNLSTSSSQSVNPRPVRPAPAPPSQKPRTASVGSMDYLESNVRKATANEGQNVNPTASRKPLHMKPRVVRIPKERLGLDKLSSWPAPVPRSPSVDTCGSPSILQPTGSVNAFFVKSDVSSQKAAPSVMTSYSDFDSRDSNGASQTQFTQQVPDKNPQTDNDQNQSGNDQEQKNEMENKEMSSPKDNADETADRSLSSPIAASIAVQTDMSDLQENNHPTKDLSQTLSDSDVQESPPRPANSVSSPANAIKCNDDEGHDTEETVTSDTDEEPTANPESRESSQAPRLTPQNAESDSHIDQDDHTKNLHINSQTKAAEDPQSGEGKPSPSPPPKPTSPLPDLLHGTKTSPGLVTPTPSAPVLSERNEKSSAGLHKPRSKDGESDSNPQNVKLTPVVRPVSKNDSGDEDEGLMMPPEGVSGRVSMIVHQINRMASVEEKHSSRKASLPFTPSDSHVEETAKDQIESVNAVQSHRTEPPLSPTKHQQTASENPTHNSTNGDAGSGSAESRRDENTYHHNVFHQIDTSMVKPTPPGEAVSSWDSFRGRQPEPGAGSRRSQSEGQTRRQSTKRSGVAPPPPTSPPPPLTRKSQRGREKSSEP